jgi:hypothetical protein
MRESTGARGRVSVAFLTEGRTAMKELDFDPDYVFSHHPPNPDQLKDYDAIHAGAKRFAEVILAHTPPSSDQNAALRLLREAAMMASAAVALEGRLK